MVYHRGLVLSLMLASLGVAAAAKGAVIQDFEGGTYSGNGTVITDPTDPTNHVLELGTGASGYTSFATSGSVGVVTMRIFDYGVDTQTFAQAGSADIWGPRWGVSNSGDPTASDPSAAIQITEAHFLDSSTAYGLENSGYLSKTGVWYSYDYYGGPRFAATLDDATTTTTNEGVGEWTTWTFNVAANGDVTITNSRNGDNKVSGTYGGTGPVDAMNSIWVFGGITNTYNYGLGVLVDDVTFTPAAPVPEPASLGLLGIGGLMLLRRRRK